MSHTPPTTVDVLIIGGGPAGLSAATWLGRYQRSTLVVDAGQQRNRFSPHVHGLTGRDPVRPADLLADARAGLAQYPQVRVLEGTVDSVHRDKAGLFQAVVGGRHPVAATRIVLTTGVRDWVPRITGLAEHYGVDVHHCPACDGMSARGQDVIAIGAGEQVPAFAAELLDWASSVRVITDTTNPAFEQLQRDTLGEHGIEVVDGIAESLVGEPGQLRGVRLRGGRVVEGTKLFFSYAHLPVNGLATQLGCELDEGGQVVVNALQLTSVDGVYAAGDITPGLQLVPIALGEGAAAGVACATSLRGHATTGDSPDPAPPTRRFSTD